MRNLWLFIKEVFVYMFHDGSDDTEYSSANIKGWDE